MHRPDARIEIEGAALEPTSEPEPRQHRQNFLIALGISCCVAAALWLSVVAGSSSGHAAPRKLPPAPPQTVHFDPRLRTGSDDIPLDQLARQGGEWEPEQVHLALAGERAVFVSWATHNASIVRSAADVRRPDLGSIASQVQWGNSPGSLDRNATGNRTSYTGDYPEAVYVSGIFHHTKLEGLAPEATYFYRCGDPDKAWSPVFSFTMPKATGAFPQRVAVIGDLGQTYNSSSTLDHLEANDPKAVWLVGDFSYSDNYTPQGERVNYSEPMPTAYHNSYQPRWDSWGRFTQRVFASRPLQGIHGNHEIELDLSGQQFQAYTQRYRFPYQESGSPSPHFYSFDFAGAHVLQLASYLPFGPGSEQAAWLQADLQRFSRERTPWLLASFHAPWYHTYIAHYKEAACHQLAMEETLYRAGVNLVLSGHVHAYSATNKVFNYSLDDCGPHHLVIGDGGNIERLYTRWVDEDPANCPDPATVQCPTYQEGALCPSRQPDWSAYREPSFGHGILELRSPTEALWQWHRNQDGAAVVAHEMRLTRDLSCPNQQQRRRR